VELAVGPIAEERGQEETTRPDYVAQSNDNAIIQGIEGSPTSFGWVGYAFAQEVGDGVRPIAVAAEPGGECVAPTAETIASGEYPLSRSLYVYVSVPAMADEPAVAEYVDFYLGEQGTTAVEQVGYVPLTEAELAATREVWTSRRTGAHEEG
jgi:phosphate transport system substrate-binding protein